MIRAYALIFLPHFFGRAPSADAPGSGCAGLRFAPVRARTGCATLTIPHAVNFTNVRKIDLENREGPKESISK